MVEAIADGLRRRIPAGALCENDALRQDAPAEGVGIGRGVKRDPLRPAATPPGASLEVTD